LVIGREDDDSDNGDAAKEVTTSLHGTPRDIEYRAGKGTNLWH
jgi:hypothetical protein